MPQVGFISFTVFDAYRHFDSQALLRSESRSCREYLIPKNNVIVLDLYFKMTNKYELEYFPHLPMCKVSV